MRLVVDACIAVKWLVNEEHTHESRQLLARRISLCAPDIILVEATNAILKKARRNEIPDPRPYLENLAVLPETVQLSPSTDLLPLASRIAVEIRHDIYDCLYLACAQTAAVSLVTADGPLHRASKPYGGVDVWRISDPELGHRVAAAPNALVISRGKLRSAIAAYALFRDSGEAAVRSARYPADSLSAVPAFRRLVDFVANLEQEDRIDLKALASFGERRTLGVTWASALDDAYAAGVQDPSYEALLGRHWQVGLDLLRTETQDPD